MEQVKLDDIQIDLSTGEFLIGFSDEIAIKKSRLKLDLNQKVDLSKTKSDLKAIGINIDNNMDPMMVEMICHAIDEQFVELGINADEITPDVYNHYINQYKDALNLDFENQDLTGEMPIISYVKSVKDFIAKDGRDKGLDKIFRKYIRQAKNSPCSLIDSTIDTRNWFEKLTDRVRAIFNPQKKLPDGIEKAIKEKPIDHDKEIEGEVLEGQDKKSKKSLGQQLHEQWQSFRKRNLENMVTGEFKDVTHEQEQSNPQKDDHDDMEQ